MSESQTDLNEFTIKRTLQLSIEEYGEENVRTAFLIVQLGDCLELGDKFAAAEREYQRAAAIYEKLGRDHELLLAIALKSQAEMAKILGRDKEAGILKSRARELMLTSLRNSDPVLLKDL
jgi:hypothetical protein